MAIVCKHNETINLIKLKTNEKSRMDICYNADINYLRPLLISMYSICDNNKIVTFHIINYGGIEIQHFDFLKTKYNISVMIYNANDEMLSMKSHGRFPPVVFGRLYIPQLIEKPKLIYVDVDTVITSNLDCLWKLPCEYIIAVEEADSKIANNLKAKYSINKYYNAGMLLINVSKTKDIFKEAIKIAKNNDLPYLDQDAINIAAKGKISSVCETYNYMSVGKSEILPKVIHFAHLKPWKKICLHGYSSIYNNIEIKISEFLPKNTLLSKISMKDVLKNIYLRFISK